jgi:hypothetical protein
MHIKVFDTEIKLEGPPYEFNPEICELSLLCEDNNGKIYSFNEIEDEISKYNIKGKYYLLFDSAKRNEIVKNTIGKYPFNNVKKWFGIFCSDPKLFPNDTPLKEIYWYFDFSDFLTFNKKDLTDKEITEIIDLMNNRSEKYQIYEFRELINLGYIKFIDQVVPKILIKIGKSMITNNNINIELLKKIKINGSNQVVWIIKNQLYPLLNLNIFSKKTWIEGKDFIVRNIHKILPYIDKKTFDIIEPLVEWDKYKERNPDDLMYKINNIGFGYKIIPKYFNFLSDQDVMKEIYKKFYSSNPENYDIFEAQYDFCYPINSCEKKVNDLKDVKNKIVFWKKIEYAIS